MNTTRSKNGGLDPSLGRQRRPAAMTVAPSSPSNGTSFPGSETHAPFGPGTGNVPEPAWLGGELQHRVHLAAAACGMSVAAVCE
ncbi:MAG: hypothetical protein VKM17_02835, partial [Cyanobacteriota bacterium]|nr:hypothetical protein [Cyanobacteriota bacterium]